MLPEGWEMRGDSSFYQWQCVGLARWFPSQFPASSEGWVLAETDSNSPTLLLLLHHLIDLALLCIPINWTEREAAICRITGEGRHILLAFSVSPSLYYQYSTVDCYAPLSLPFPFFSLTPQLLTRASCFRGIIHRFFFKKKIKAPGDNVLLMKNRSYSYAHRSCVTEVRNHSVESTAC